MSKATISSLVNEHSFLTSSTDIERHFNISTTTVQRIFKYAFFCIYIDEFKGNAGANFQVIINYLVNYNYLNNIEDYSPDILYAKILEYPLEE